MEFRGNKKNAFRQSPIRPICPIPPGLKKVVCQFEIKNRTVALIFQRGGFRFWALGQYVASAFIYCGFCGRHSWDNLFALACSLHIRAFSN
jgi:hypothetical protein